MSLWENFETQKQLGGVIDFGKYVDEIKEKCKQIRQELLSKSPLLELNGGINICGDIHGQFNDLLEIFNRRGSPSQHNQYLFLGDYVDRGKHSLETILYLYYLKLKYPAFIHLLRGNHESASITKEYGFFDECKRRIPCNGVKVWKTIIDTFNCLPIAAIVGGRIFCVHGGLSPELTNFQQIASILRPTDIHESGLVCDLLWSDPKRDIEGWDMNERGTSYTFGKDILQEFCDRMQIQLVCRAHQVVEDGYEFFGDRKCITIFSAPNYSSDFENAGAIMCVSPTLHCEIVSFPASSYRRNEGYYYRSSAHTQKNTKTLIEGRKEEKTATNTITSSNAEKKRFSTPPPTRGVSTPSSASFANTSSSNIGATYNGYW